MLKAASLFSQILKIELAENRISMKYWIPVFKTPEVFLFLNLLLQPTFHPIPHFCR